MLTDNHRAFLKVIAENPDLDAPRLVYADWLDEFGRTDFDAATSEFIRLSCPLRATPVMPRAAYPWIGANWRRLLPTIFSIPNRMTKADDARRVGATIRTSANRPIPGLRVGGHLCGHMTHTVRMVLEFRRGFLERFSMYSVNVAPLVWPTIRLDQPIAEVTHFGM